jgi:hypothetical protein
VRKVRETRANHQEEYSTWSDPIMAKNMFGVMSICNECYILKYYYAFDEFMHLMHKCV